MVKPWGATSTAAATTCSTTTRISARRTSTPTSVAGASARSAFASSAQQKKIVIDYKDPQALKYFVSERGKVVPRRISGNCARHQRKINQAVKRARNIALLPFTVTT